jgi:hypothetical protein
MTNARAVPSRLAKCIGTSEPLKQRLADGVVPPIFSMGWTFPEPSERAQVLPRETLLKGVLA